MGLVATFDNWKVLISKHLVSRTLLSLQRRRRRENWWEDDDQNTGWSRYTQSRMCINSLWTTPSNTTRKQERIPIQMCSADYVGEKTILHLSGSRAAALWLRQSIARHNAALKILYFEILRDRGLVQTVPQGRIKGGGALLGKCQGPADFLGLAVVYMAPYVFRDRTARFWADISYM